MLPLDNEMEVEHVKRFRIIYRGGQAKNNVILAVFSSRFNEMLEPLNLNWSRKRKG